MINIQFSSTIIYAFGFLSEKYKLENDGTLINSIQLINSKMMIAKYNKSQNTLLFAAATFRGGGLRAAYFSKFIVVRFSKLVKKKIK